MNSSGPAFAFPFRVKLPSFSSTPCSSDAASRSPYNSRNASPTGQGNAKNNKSTVTSYSARTASGTVTTSGRKSGLPPSRPVPLQPSPRREPVLSVTPRGGLSAASTVEWGTGPQPSSRSSWAPPQQTPLAKQTQQVKSHPTTESWSVTSAAQLSQQAKQPQSTHKKESRESHDQSREQQQQHWKFIEETDFEKCCGSHQVPCVADKSAQTCVTLIRSDGPPEDKGTGVLCLIL